MLVNKTKQKLQDGKPVFGCTVQFDDPFITEVIGAAGFDFILIDGQHAPLDGEKIFKMTRGFAPTESQVIVRVVWNETWLINQALDMGADGVIIPLPNTADEVRRAVKAAKYPPKGVRSNGPRKTDHLGGFGEYQARANEETIVWPQIESQEAIDNIDEIVEQSDALMVARGDMGVEVPLKRVPVIQKDLIRRSNSAGKPVITATQMLESMINSSSPTRAEVTDVANAVYDGSDAIMLSGETSIGEYPVEAVKVMAETAMEAESALPYARMMAERFSELEALTDDVISFAACQTSNELASDLIVAFTESGSSAGRVSRYRPRAKILALTPWEHVRNRLTLRWGVFPVIVANVADVDEFFSLGEMECRKVLGLKGGNVVLVAGTPIGVPGSTNLLRVLNLD